MDCIERGDKLRIEGEGVRLNELEGVIRLGYNIYTDHGKPGPTVSDASAASTTEKIEQPRLFRSLDSHALFDSL